MVGVKKHFVILLILFSSVLSAQFSRDASQRSPRVFSPITFEVIPFFTDDTTAVELIIQYRINPAFLFFAKTVENQQESYEARGELVIEILDENDVVITRAIRPLQIERTSVSPEGISQRPELQGAVTFRLKKNIYKISVEAKDIESEKTFVNRDTKLDARFSTTSGLCISQPIFVEAMLSDTIASHPKEFIPVNQGGNIIIGQSGGYLFQICIPDTGTNIQVGWMVTSKSEKDENFQQPLSGDHYFQWAGLPTVVENHGGISYNIKEGSKHSRIIFIPIPTERLEEGRYSLEITVKQGVLTKQKESTFNVIWPMKPLSLSDFKLAVSALQHIATEEEMNQMTSLSTSKAKSIFREFWKKRNSDTTRAYNPKMAEYYRRVDEVNRRFSSENDLNGYRTDRGRIYILFGAPTKTDRLLKPNMAPTEIWTYDTLKRRFIFTDSKKTGNYILVQTENY